MDSKLEVHSAHPDANRWSAYFDGALGRGERRALIRHLADCSDCRRVSAALGRMSTPLGSDARRPAWAPLARTPRWDAPLALAATVLVVVGAALWLRLPAPVSAPAPTLAAVAHTVAPEAPTVAPLGVRHLATSPAPTQLRPPARLATNLPPAPAPQQLQPANAATLAGPAASLPSMSAALEPALDFAPLTTGFQDQARLPAAPFALASWNGNAPVPRVTLAAGGDLLPVAPPATGNAATASSTAYATGFSSGTGSAAVRTPTRRGPLGPSLTPGLGWAISHSGQLLRSLGAGVWEAVPLVPGVHLHALANLGGVIWTAAGLSQIFTSSDNGATWRQVTLPSASGTAEVRGIRLADPMHVVIAASDGHSWSTSDGGVSWTQK